MATKPLGLHVPPKGRTWVYDFTVNGRRYSKSTKTRNYAEALKIALAIKAQAEGLVPERIPRKPEISLREAFGRFYMEKGQYEENHATVLGQLERMALGLGPDLHLSSLTSDDLLKYQSQRRKKVKNRTVNAEVPELLRRVVTRAKMWGVAIPDIDWAPLKLPLPAHRTRAASRKEQAKLLVSLRKDYRPIILFAIKTGLRKQALLIRKDHVDWDQGILVYRKKSKRTNDLDTLPLSRQLMRLIRAEAAKSKYDQVFTYECRKSRGGRKKGERYPITGPGLREAMEEAVKAAGLKDWRLIHDLRHTAATDALRVSQNLALVQRMLGHSDISQTARYAHVIDEDLRTLMNSPRKSGSRA